MEDHKTDDITVATPDESPTIGSQYDYMTSTARQAASKMCLPPPGNPPPFKIAYWDESRDLGISARYLAVAAGNKRRRIESHADEAEIVDVTSLNALPSLPPSHASNYASIIKQYDVRNEDVSVLLEGYEDSGLALVSWMGEVKGRIQKSPRTPKTEDDVWSEHFGPARISRELDDFYRNRLSRHDAIVTLPSYRSYSHKALLRSGLNAQPIPLRFAHEISAKARLDGHRTSAKHRYADQGYRRYPRLSRTRYLERLRCRKPLKPSSLRVSK